MVTTTEFDELIEVLRDFIRREVMPAEAGIDESDEIPDRLITQAKEMGLYGYALPSEFGGLGLSVEQQVLVTMELGYTSPAFRSLFGTNNGIAGQVLVLAGTEEQRKHWLPRLASGEVVASFALTEPDAGSDPSRLVTSAVPVSGPGGAVGSVRANTMKTSAAGALVMYRLRPSMTQPPSGPGSGTAEVTRRLGSDPASGSVSANDATTSPEASRGSHCLRCSSVPASTRTWPAMPLFVPNSDRNAGLV